MKRLLLTCLVLSSYFLHLQAQPLRSVGPVPADLRMSVQELYDSDIQRAQKYAGGRVRDKEAVLQASYRINKMLAGGHVVYGDPITDLANRIADTLLRDYPELRAELRFYTITSPDVNAFTTPQGMIFINAGLVAQAENEAQLAFIIAHEIIHYYRAHGLETLVGKDGKKKRGENLDDEAEHAGDFTHKHIRSHEMENEADSLGIALFYLNSPYWKDVSEGVFDVLQYSYLPFDEVPFDTTFFNTQYYRLTGCWLDTVADITSRDNYDDSRSTHPNILSRRQRTANALAGHAGGQKYLMVSQEEFEHLRHIARIECIRQDLLHGNYPRAFYNSWVMLRDDNDNPTLNAYLAQAIYGIAVFKCNERGSEVVGDYAQVEGEIQQVYYAFHQMNAEQATLAALHKVWEMHKRYPRDGHYDAMYHHLMELLRAKCQKSATDYLPTPPAASTDTVAITDTTQTSNKPLSKYERIKQKRQTQTQRHPTSYALTDLMEADSSLYPTLVGHLNGNAQPSTPKSQVSTREDAMLVFNPSYWVTDGKDNLRTAESDACEEDLISRIAGTTRKMGIRTVDFSDQGLHAMTSAEQYNDFLTVCEWMNEFWLTKGTFELNRLIQPDMDRLLSRYDARTLNMTVILNMEGQEGDGWLGMYYLIPLIPVAIVNSFSGLEHTIMVSLVVDAHEGQMLTRQAYHYNVADHPALVNAMLYDTYVRTAKPSPKEPVGHMGHRLGLAGGFNFGLAGRQNFSAHQYVAFTPWASAEFALNRRFSLAVTARYQKSNPNIYQEVYAGEQLVTYHNYYGSYQVYQPYYDTVQSSRNMLTLGLELRSYRHSDFAPFGRYVDYGLHMVRMVTLDNQTANNTFGFHIGLGRNYIFLDRLLLNYQIDYGYTYGFIKSFFGFEEDTRPYHYYSDAILSNILTLKLGIGFIPF